MLEAQSNRGYNSIDFLFENFDLENAQSSGNLSQ